MKLRFISDVHGKCFRYVELAAQADYSVQLGDMGFDYSVMEDRLDPSRHRVLGGNHDCYAEEAGRFVKQPAHFLGDYGVHTVPGFGDMFFVRGGHSIDYGFRTEGRDWWPAEQLTWQQGYDALEMYKQVKPDFVISHECPAGIIDLFAAFKEWGGEPIRPSRTAHLLQSMWDAHQPKEWLFGHHHQDWESEVRGTNFRCMKELGYIDYRIGD